MLQKLKNIDKRTWLIISAVLIVIIALIVVLSTFYVKHKNAVVKQPKAKKVVATQVETTKSTTTEPTTRKDIITVKLKCSSVQNDLNIKFIDKKSNQYIKNIPFKVSVKDKSGKEKTYTDKDVDGKIYLTKIKASDYTVKLKPMKEYVFTPYSAKVTVKDKPEYKVVKDIKEEVKKDPGHKEDKKENHDVVQGNELKDTVEYVMSTQNKIGDDIKYIAVDKKNIDTNVLAEAAVMAQPESPDNPTTDPPTTKPEKLYDKDGHELYYKTSGEYKLAFSYDESVQYYYKKVIPVYKYTGWQNIDGKRYYYDKNGKLVTGEQVIGGAKYHFNSDGSLCTGAGVLGIDVSYHQGYIDWKKVKASGVEFAIIRCGYRGWGTGKLVEDEQFKRNIRGATANGINVGVYFFSQAINEGEAVKEASLCVDLVKGYRLKYPIFIDTETSGGYGSGRADKLTVDQRTNVCKAFCKTIRNSGYQAGVYTSKSWFQNKLHTSQLNQYRIWLAQWNDKPTYSGKYDLWQYSSKGKVDGISGSVDMNLSYMPY